MTARRVAMLVALLAAVAIGMPAPRGAAGESEAPRMAAPATRDAATSRAPGILELAWLRAGTAHYRELGSRFADPGASYPGAVAPVPPELTTSLGSIWKLFVHVYLSGRATPGPDYTCRGIDTAQEAFCCGPGGRIGADDALARSCGLFFEPTRLGITAREWRAHWSARGRPGSAEWLLDLDRLRPDTVVTVASLLEALAAIEPDARRHTEHVLLGGMLATRPSPVRTLGSALRVKTWTWDRDGGMPSSEHEGTSATPRAAPHVGGFAGWLADGTPVWARGDGAGINVLQRITPVLAAWVDADRVRAVDTECVLVRFFARYPLADVADLAGGTPAVPGPLHGRFAATFTAGTRIELRSQGELTLERAGGGPVITGRIGLNEYVARVVDREAAAQPVEAARALAVAARSYLVQNAARRHGCYEIDDSTRTQRVSPSPATAAARAVADWTDGIVLRGAPVTYHQSRADRNTLAWSEAVASAAGGETFDEILARAYADADLAPLWAEGRRACERLTSVERWLTTQAPRWRERLARQPGYEMPDMVVACRLHHARPYADPSRDRIYVRGLASLEDRIAIVHEYLHLAFRRHPRGLDEAFIEDLAREIVREP